MATHKDFAKWAEIKTDLQAKVNPRTFKELEIWWVVLGHNIGDEEDGKGRFFMRPVLVLRKFNKNLFWGIPLTTTDRKNRYYVEFCYKPSRSSSAILSQLRLFDAKRLLRQDGIIDDLTFAKIQLGLINIIRKEPRK